MERSDENYYPYLDYVRAAAAFGVLVSHSDHWSLLPSNLGGASVQVFFALSGFLIGGILFRSKPADLPRFYFNRATRVWIPYFIAIYLVLIATVLKQPLRDPKIWEIMFYNVSFVYNIFGPSQLADNVARFPLEGTANHFWSICVEEQFYLLAPFIIVFVPRAALQVAAGLLILNLFVPHDFAAISAGVLLARGEQIYGARFVQRTVRILVGCILLIIAAAISLYPNLYPALFPIAAVCSIMLFAERGSRQQFGAIAGGMSFSLYLNAWVAFFALNYIFKTVHFSAPVALGTVIGALLALGMSFAHYELIDRNIMKNRSKWFTTRSGATLCLIGFFLVTIGICVGLFLTTGTNARPLNL
jgi:peptidoglycan/LPS O-acetylase OafA/YrhL